MTEFKNLKKCIGNIGQQNIVERFFFVCVCVDFDFGNSTVNCQTVFFLMMLPSCPTIFLFQVVS